MYLKILTSTLFILIYIQSNYLLSQTNKENNRAVPQTDAIYKIKYGFFGGLNMPLSPEEMTKIPKIYDKSTESLLNGLDGLGYKTTYIIGFQGKFNFYPEFWAGGNFAYTSWLSKNSCFNDSIPTVNSENFLSLFTFGINSFYYFTDIFYSGVGVDINLFYVNVKENDSKRENIDFVNKYTRLGLNLMLGADIPIFKKVSFDVSVKAQLTNLLGLQNDNPETSRSEAIINQYGSPQESHIILLLINFGIMFSSN